MSTKKPFPCSLWIKSCHTIEWDGYEQICGYDKRQRWKGITSEMSIYEMCSLQNNNGLNEKNRKKSAISKWSQWIYITEIYRWLKLWKFVFSKV